MESWFERFLAGGEAHRSAFSEVFLVALLSLLPLLFLPFIDHVNGRTESVLDLGYLFSEAVSGGQLYLYSFAMFGTLFWLCLKDYKTLLYFPPRKWIMLLLVILMLVIFGVYINDPWLRRPLSSSLITTSIIVYILYLLLYYVLKVFDNIDAPTVSSALKTATKNLIEKYNDSEDRNG